MNQRTEPQRALYSSPAGRQTSVDEGNPIVRPRADLSPYEDNKSSKEIRDMGEMVYAAGNAKVTDIK
jgi:hypothetical protein